MPGAAAADLAPTTSACGQTPGFLSAVPRGPDAIIARNKYFWLLARTEEMTTDTISPGTSLSLTLRPVKGLIHAESTRRARPGSTGTVILPKGVTPWADDAHPLNSQFCFSRQPSPPLSTPSQGKSEECAKDDSVISQLGLILGSLSASLCAKRALRACPRAEAGRAHLHTVPRSGPSDPGCTVKPSSP